MTSPSDRSSGRVESEGRIRPAVGGHPARNSNDSVAPASASLHPRRGRPSLRLPELAASLTERDQAVMTTLRQLRLATGQQLERLHFAGVSDRERRRVLAGLTRRRVITRLPRRIGGVRSGSAGYLYALDIAGQRLTDGTGPARGHMVQRPWTPGPAYLSHALAVTELSVRLVEAERRGELRVRSFHAEPAAWRRYLDQGGGILTLKPDATVRIRVNGFEDSWYIEMDRATESPRALARKCEAYRAYWSSGQEQARHGVFPRVLFIVPDAARHAVLVDVFGRQPAEAWPLFAVCLFEAAVARLREGAAS